MRKPKFYYVYDDSIQRKVPHIKLGNKLVSLSTGTETIIEKKDTPKPYKRQIKKKVKQK